MARGRDGPVHIGRAPHGNYTSGLFGRRIDDIEVVARGRVNPLTVDVKLSVLVRHASPYYGPMLSRVS
jgi:hypothetical protein